WIDELYFDIRPYPVEVTIPPDLERVCRSCSTALIRRPVKWPACRVSLDLIWPPILYVYAAAVRLPPGDTGSEVFVGILDPFVILVLVFILWRFRIRISEAPENLDVLVPLLIGFQSLEGATLILRYNG